MPENPYPQIPWMNTAYSLIGTKETPGPRDTAEILEWADVLELQMDYTADSIPWCGLFVAFCMADNGIPPVTNPLFAKNWIGFGTELTPPSFGAIMVFSRSGGGHVAFYVDEDTDSYIILGGNQADAVNIERHSKSGFLGARWPSYMNKFLTPDIPMV